MALTPVQIGALALGGVVVVAVIAASSSERTYQKRLPATRDFNLRVQKGARTPQAKARKMDRLVEQTLARADRARERGERDRARADRFAERAALALEKAEARAERAKVTAERKGTKTAAVKAQAAQRFADTVKEGASIDIHSLTPSEARELMSQARFKNPDGLLGLGEPAKAESNLDQAMRMSEQFHGTKGEVLQLSPAERHISEYVVALGTVPGLDYDPDQHSDRHGEWSHKSGDRGELAPKGYGRPILAVDPKTRRPVIVMHRSGMRFDPNRGLVG